MEAHLESLRYHPPVAAPPRSRYRFGPFELDPRSGELFRDLSRVRLQEQPLLALLLLLERPGELVTHDELRARVWPNGTFVVFDHGLHGVIARLRESLGDASDAPTYIETLPRRGYRFVAPVSLVADEAAPARPGPASEPDPEAARPIRPAARPAWPRIATLTAVAGLAAVAGVLAWM